MRVLVNWSSNEPQAEAIANVIGGVLEHEGHDVTLTPAEHAVDLRTFEAVILGCCAHPNHRPTAAQTFVAENEEVLRHMPVWLFSWAPLGDAYAGGQARPLTEDVKLLMQRIRARGHASFDAHLPSETSALHSAVSSRERTSEWRNAVKIADWARSISLAIFSSSAPDSARSRPSAEPMGAMLGALCLFVGVTAIWGGATLMAVPEGYPTGLSALLREYAPFHDFFVPGLLLALVVGVSNTVAGYLALRGSSLANRAALASGACLTAWIVTELLLLRILYWLQQAYLLAGVVILTIAAYREHRLGRLGTTIRSTIRIAKHALVGWALCDATRDLLAAYAHPSVAVIVQALSAPIIFAVIAEWYFDGADAWGPIGTAAAFVLVVAVLDVFGVACVAARSFSMFRNLASYWLPLLLVFGATWATGERHRRRYAGRLTATSS